jgi:predicted nucleotidyltransferase
MTFVPDRLQEMVLDRCQEWADGFAAVRRISIFGSVGRGDYHAESDIDLYFDFDTSNPSEFERTQQGLTRFQVELAKAAGRSVSLHYELFGDQTDSASKAVMDRRRSFWPRGERRVL